ncbi:MAG: hypothetical protein ABI723_16185, partial [Bacteroidia bacterium]
MKNLITLLLIITTVAATAQSDSTATANKESKFSLNFGGGYVNWGGEENGFIAFNEFQYHFTSRISAGTNLYFAKTKYGYDSKNNPTFFTGFDINAYYTIFKNKNFRESIGAGYAFRFMNSSYDENYHLTSLNLVTLLGYSPYLT